MAKETLPNDTVSVIYHCHVCHAKNTYGRDYFSDVGTPDKCLSCGTPYLQEDRIPRLDKDTPEDLESKRDALLGRRGVPVVPRPKPADPDEIKRQRISELDAELRRLKNEGVKPNDQGPKLGP